MGAAQAHRKGLPSRHWSFGRLVGVLGGLAVFAALLQWTGTVDLGLPMGPDPPAGEAESASQPLSMAAAQFELRDVVRSAASVVSRASSAGSSRAEPDAQAPPERGAPPARPSDPAQGAGANDPATAGINAATAAALAALKKKEPGAVPPPTIRADGYRSEVERAWFRAGRGLPRRALHARSRALQLGAANYEEASRALLAPNAPGAVLERALLAVRLSPDLPLARMKLGAAYFEDGQYLNAAQQVVDGVVAIPRNLEATLWLVASLLAMFAAVLTIGSMAFIVWIGVSVFHHAAHDVGDLVSREMPEFARVALLGAVLLVPVVLGEAAMGLVAALFLLGFMYVEAGYRRALALSAVLLVLGVYPVTRMAGMALTTLDADPVAAAADAVVRSMSSAADIETLRLAAFERDALAGAGLALHERRSGDPEAALRRYQGLLEQNQTDPVVLAVLSNMHFERGDNELAIVLGERAAGLTRSATLLFNLSQMYARSFRMDESESAMGQAQLIDAEVVANLSRAKASDFVADLAFPKARIRDRMLRAAVGDRFVEIVSKALMPGQIGRGWQATAGVFGAAAVLGLLLGGRWGHASSCSRCGRRICGRCDGTVWNNRICDGCHHLFHLPETTDPAMRMARLSELQERETRVARIATVASLLVPGVAGLLARRPDLGVLGLFFFVWALVLILWREGVVVDPLVVGAAGPLVFVVAGSLAALGYALVVTLGIAIRRRL